jgi:hypothetical protein
MREILQLAALRSSCHSCPAEHFSTDNSTNWVPGWQPFHINHLVFSSQADLKRFELSYLPTSYFTSLGSTELLTTDSSLAGVLVI